MIKKHAALGRCSQVQLLKQKTVQPFETAPFSCFQAIYKGCLRISSASGKRMIPTAVKWISTGSCFMPFSATALLWTTLSRSDGGSKVPLPQCRNGENIFDGFKKWLNETSLRENEANHVKRGIPANRQRFLFCFYVCVNTPGLVSRGCLRKKKHKEEKKLYANGRLPGVFCDSLRHPGFHRDAQRKRKKLHRSDVFGQR